MIEPKILVPGVCAVCGCTDTNCSDCIERTGRACTWVGLSLCSACVPTRSKLEKLRRQGKALKKAEGIRHTYALDLIAKQNGCAGWTELQRIVSETYPEVNAP